jgi:hypothetical protein
MEESLQCMKKVSRRNRWRKMQLYPIVCLYKYKEVGVQINITSGRNASTEHWQSLTEPCNSSEIMFGNHCNFSQLWRGVNKSLLVSCVTSPLMGTIIVPSFIFDLPSLGHHTGNYTTACDISAKSEMTGYRTGRTMEDQGQKGRWSSRMTKWMQQATNLVQIRISSVLSHVGQTTGRILDWILNLLTTYTHDSTLRA